MNELLETSKINTTFTDFYLVYIISSLILFTGLIILLYRIFIIKKFENYFRYIKTSYLLVYLYLVLMSLQACVYFKRCADFTSDQYQIILSLFYLLVIALDFAVFILHSFYTFEIIDNLQLTQFKILKFIILITAKMLYSIFCLLYYVYLYYVNSNYSYDVNDLLKNPRVLLILYFCSFTYLYNYITLNLM